MKEFVLKDDEEEIWFESLEAPFDLITPFHNQDFVCLLVVNDEHITDEQQSRLSKTLVESGCRYACCTGQDSSSWDTSIDTAYLETDENFTPPDERFVMTTWPDHETLEDTIFFFLKCTIFDNLIFTRRFILFLGKDEKNKQELIKLVFDEKNRDAN